MKFYLLVIFTFFTPIVAFSQEEATFSVEYIDEPLSDVLVSLEELFNVRFSFSDRDVTNQRITLSQKERSLNDVLLEISDVLVIKFQRLNHRYISLTKTNNTFDRVLQLDDVVINGYLSRGIAKYKDATFRINPNRLEILPGLTEADIFESIQLLPGVVSPNETASGLIVRGGSSDQNRIIWDGINTYHKGHLFGMISPFNPNATKNVTFYNKGTHPRFGERISSVINIESSNEVARNVRAGIGFNALNGDAYLEVPIVKDKLSIQASARRSYTELYQSFTFDELAEKVFQSTKIANSENTTNNFFFLDYNLKVNYQPDEINRFSFSALYIDNDLDYLVSDMDTDQSFNDLLNIRNTGYSLSWKTRWNDRVSQHTQAVFSRYQFDYSFNTFEGNERIRKFEKKNTIFDSSLSSEIEINTEENGLFTAGYQYNLKDVSYAFLDSGDLDFVLDSDQTLTSIHGLFVNYENTNFRFFDVNIGIRMNYYQELNAARFEPRVLIYKEIVENLKVQISGEIKNQIISEIDETVLSDLSLENRLWRLADGETFPIINSHQITAGLLYENDGFSLDIDGYYKKIDGITALSLGFLNPADANFHIGKQRGTGIDFYVKKDFNFFKTWLSYSFSNVVNNFEGLNENADFTASTNIEHAFSTSFSYKRKQFQIALAWHWRTGKPFTRATTPFNDDNVVFQGINTERLPEYHRMDVSTTYNFYFSKKEGIRGKLGFSIRNVYNRKNQLSREYTGNNNLNDPIQVVDKFSLGLTPNFLFRADW